MDDLSPLRDLGRALEHDPPPSLARQRSRLTDAARDPRARRGLRRRRPRGWTALALAACAVAALLLVPAVLLRPDGHHRKPVNGLTHAANRPMNVLILGSDVRGPADGAHPAPARSDTIVLVRLPADRKNVTVVSLPRDLMVQRPSCLLSDGTRTTPGRGQINGAYSEGGLACAIKTVESVASVRIDQAVVLEFGGFARIVDALGGVPVTLPVDVNDPASGLHLGAGKHMLNGKDALAYARLRHGIGDGSDLSRIKRQQKFMAAVYERAHHLMLSNPIRFAEFLRLSTASVRAIPSLDLANMKALAESLTRTGSSRPHFVTLPNRPDASDPNRLEVDKPKADQVLAPFREP